VLYLIWLRGLLLRRWVRLAATVVGVAIPVAFVAVLAGFFASTRARMTEQAIADVAIDWQVQLASTADPQQAIAELAKSPGYTNALEVGYFTSPGFESTSGGTVQVTGAGKVLGLQQGYQAAFPAEIRTLVGQGDVLLAQQTAANLHAQPGSIVSIKRAGLPPVDVTVDAVVDLPLADSLFQVVGAPAGSAPQAPPDNVLLIPLDRWRTLFTPVAGMAPDALSTQVHASIPHNLPADPSGAFTKVQGLARNYETRLPGAVTVGDNLAARLDAARSDALYAQVLFLFLGLPGVMLSALLTTVLISSGSVRRRREQALLRLRGASTATLVRLASIEALCIAIGGSTLGLVLASLTVHATFGRWGFGNGQFGTLEWGAVACAGGFILALATVLLPAWRDAVGSSFVGARATVRRTGSLLWERLGLDVIFLVLAAFSYWLTARNGYQVVVAPEGVARVSVSYTAFLAPLLLWLGAALMTVRLTRLLLARKARAVAPALWPLAGRLSGLIAASLSRQSVLIAVGAVLVALSVAFATSTAIFNATYRDQSRVDAELTNGADVTVTGSVVANLADRLPAIQQLDGVTAAEPLQHRFAYVGADLQDIFGVHADTIGRAATLSDAFFASGSARGTLATLSSVPDGLLVSAETVKDFQLQPGDLVRLRLQSALDNQYHVIDFHYIGIAREFPTAPRDSFLVANADYIAQQTSSAAVEAVLIRTDRPAAVAGEVRTLLGPTAGATVRDIGETQGKINSGLTAVSLRGITRIELSLAVGMAAAGAGLVLVLGLEERRRSLAIVSALGARRSQLAAFVWSEAIVMLGAGGAAGAALGWGVAHVLVKLLTGVFDPPPDHLAVPWLYLGVVAVATVAAVLIAGQIMTRMAGRSVLETIRRL
jgi:putative ABC transport system permease protein